MIKRANKLTEFFNIQAFKDKNIASVIFLNLFITTLQVSYTFARFRFLNPDIPFWYTKPWGDSQLANRDFIYLIPALSIFLIIIAVFAIDSMYKAKNKEAIFNTLFLLTISIVFLFVSEARIIFKGSSPYNRLTDENVLQLAPLVFISFLLCTLIVPFVIRLAKRFDMVTDPAVHSHPGMILTKPSARAGGLAFFLAFLIVSVLFVPIDRGIAGLLIGMLITTILGLFDDKKSVNPYIRLSILPISIIITILITNLRVLFFANPADGIMRLDLYQINFTYLGIKFFFIPIADIFTTLWVLWIMNMLSWSNAVDGQYSGMTAITCLVIAVLALRLIKVDPAQINTARLAAIAAGASLGILPYNWHPSKIMWGFGATTMGLVIAMLSIMSGTKVAAATLVLIVPTLDAIVTILRRIIQKKSPVWGDRGHFHHRLLDMGFSQQEVAIFYWILTAIFGVIALISSGRDKFLALMTVGGLVAFVLIATNLKGELSKLKQQEPEKRHPKEV